MELQALPALAEDYPAYREMKAQIAQGGVVQMEGVPVTAKGWLLAQLARETGRPWLVTYNADQAQRLGEDLRAYGVPEAGLAHLTSSTETLIFTEGAPDLGILGRVPPPCSNRRGARRRSRSGLSGRGFNGPSGPNWCGPAGRLTVGRRWTSAAGADAGEFGYERVEAVEQPGQWTRRGDILDVFPGDAARPFRVDFFGDDVEAIRPFDPETQRSRAGRRLLTLRPVRELPYEKEAVARATARLLDELPGRVKALRAANLEERGAEHAERLEECVEGDVAQLRAQAYFDTMEYYLPFLYPDAVCALDYLPADAILVLDEPSQAKARWEQMEGEIADIAETRAARGEWISADTPHACGFDALMAAIRGPHPVFATPPPIGMGEGPFTNQALLLVSGQMTGCEATPSNWPLSLLLWGRGGGEGRGGGHSGPSFASRCWGGSRRASSRAGRSPPSRGRWRALPGDCRPSLRPWTPGWGRASAWSW